MTPHPIRKRSANLFPPELIDLLDRATAAGEFSITGVADLRRWLELNSDSTVPQVELLASTLDGVESGDFVSVAGRKALYSAAEKALPPKHRASLRARRTARELAEKAKRSDQKESDRTAKAQFSERNRIQCSENFVVRGVHHKGRAAAVAKHVRPGHSVSMVREIGNPYDSNAVRIHTGEGSLIGYVPRELAGGIALLLDQPHKYIAVCTKILGGDRSPKPVIDLAIYGPEAAVDGQIADTFSFGRVKILGGDNVPKPVIDERIAHSFTVSPVVPHDTASDSSSFTAFGWAIAAFSVVVFLYLLVR